VGGAIMTALTRPVRRVTAASYGGRPLIVELHPGFVILRLKGKRHQVSVDYQSIMDLGYRILARQEQAERPKARDALRKGERR